jgi:hypothetical protein
MIYQHATSEADRAIADALNAAVKAHHKTAKKTWEVGEGPQAQAGQRRLRLMAR